MKIMQGDQAQPEDFFRLDQMAQITAGEFATGGTEATFLDRAFLQGELGVL